MKVKPTSKSGGVLVELGPKETQLPAARPDEIGAPLPVFQLRRILVPIDFSDCAKKALRYAIPFAEQFEATLVLLYAVQPYIPVPDMVTVDVELVETQMRESGQRELDALKRSVGNRVPVETALCVGSPHVEIVKAVKSLDIDLIILSTHGRTGLAHVVLGSTAERVVRHAGCPVLVVHEPEREFIQGETSAGRPPAASKPQHAHPTS